MSVAASLRGAMWGSTTLGASIWCSSSPACQRSAGRSRPGRAGPI